MLKNVSLTGSALSLKRFEQGGARLEAGFWKSYLAICGSIDNEGGVKIEESGCKSIVRAVRWGGGGGAGRKSKQRSEQ